MKKGVKIMTKISKYDLCEKCRQIRLIPAGEKLPELSAGGFLDGIGYNQPMGYIAGNMMLLSHLETKGGCTSCINLLRRAQV